MENTKLFLTRHLQRIDDSDSSWDLSRQWNSVDSKKIDFTINPYLSDHADRHVDNVVAKITEPIDIIISSPFLRCMQTALKIMNQCKLGYFRLPNFIEFANILKL